MSEHNLNNLLEKIQGIPEEITKYLTEHLSGLYSQIDDLNNKINTLQNNYEKLKKSFNEQKL